eukprot:gb/GFBE01042213.1/.p1 GENE.gb/GFBE01042213.1/~~gb/GFBE01042213.1/.p1  ORF type:complete len:166 (+),score=30.73 gb/GFBE01042213.1/:1-498(+)
MNARECFNKHCGSDAPAPLPDDCFTGSLVCQHGETECQANRWLACAKEVAGAGAVQTYMPFTHCLEAGYDSFSKDLVLSCASSSGVDTAALTSCYDGSAGDEAVVANAKVTPQHPGVPYILVDGKSLDQPNGLLKAVCDAYKGSRPAACQKAESSEAWLNIFTYV